MHIAVAQECNSRLIPAVDSLAAGFEMKMKEFENLIKIGRTHLQVIIHNSWNSFSISLLYLVDRFLCWQMFGSSKAHAAKQEIAHVFFLIQMNFKFLIVTRIHLLLSSSRQLKEDFTCFACFPYSLTLPSKCIISKLPRCFCIHRLKLSMMLLLIL